ncbi:MAG: UDP-glucose 4-epimerase [Bacteroidetes bacterium]|nr:MAG: UDP-glucose 4-epimerase [Bacteroidota bacterium]
MNERIRQSSFLVTGGAGFIGSHISATLLESGAKHVRVLDNLSTGYRDNIKELLPSAGFEFIEGDIRDPETCRKACSDMDFVLHNAALGSVSRSITDPGSTHQVNADGFFNMLDAARLSGIKRFVYASSSSVYGDDPSMPKKEERTGNPLSPYAVTKVMNEAYANVFSRVYGMPTVGLRYFNVFGPYQNIHGPYAAVIPIFITKMLSGVRPEIFGDGKNTRDFTFVKNVVQANIKAVLSEKTGNGGFVFNVACGETIALLDLYAEIARLMDFPHSPDFKPERAGDIRNSWADISHAAEYLGYRPEMTWKEGIRITVDWYRSQLSKQ